jgi:hypothetical protein
MGPRRLTRSRVFRAVALGAAVAPIGIAWGVASCILADPPPSLPTLPPLLPQIEVDSVVPPLPILTSWPSAGGLNFAVPVSFPIPNAPQNVVVFEDYGTPASVIAKSVKVPPPLDGGSQVLLQFNLPKPPDESCHYVWLWAGDGTSFTATQADPPLSPATLTCDPAECTFVKWLYDPVATGACSLFDAGPLPAVPEASAGVKLKID